MAAGALEGGALAPAFGDLKKSARIRFAAIWRSARPPPAAAVAAKARAQAEAHYLVAMPVEQDFQTCRQIDLIRGKSISQHSTRGMAVA